MMVKFEIASEKTETIDGVGLVGPDLPPVVLSDEQAEIFASLHGVRIANANFASHISVTAMVTADGSVEEV